MFGKGQIKLGKIFGIEVALDLSWFIILILIVWSFYSVFTATFNSNSVLINLGYSLLAAVIFFVSILAHEISHTLVARKNGIPVSNITLFVFGGVSSIEEEPPNAGIEFKMAIAGPLLSLITGALLFYLGSIIRSHELAEIAFLLRSLGTINFLLGFFNLLPGFPLDGGRILRALIWARTKNIMKATRYASLSGRALAIVMILLGIAQFFFVSSFGGLWLVLIGFFLYRAATASIAETRFYLKLKNKNIGEIANPDYQKIKSGTSILEILKLPPSQIYIVEDNSGIIGLGTLPQLLDLSEVEREQAIDTRMIDWDKIPRSDAKENLSISIKKFIENKNEILAVYSNNLLVGFVQLKDVLSVLGVAKN